MSYNLINVKYLKITKLSEIKTSYCLQKNFYLSEMIFERKWQKWHAGIWQVYWRSTYTVWCMHPLDFFEVFTSFHTYIPVSETIKYKILKRISKFSIQHITFLSNQNFRAKFATAVIRYTFLSLASQNGSLISPLENDK